MPFKKLLVLSALGFDTAFHRAEYILCSSIDSSFWVRMAEIVFHTLKKLERDLQLAQVRYATERETSHVITQRVDAGLF